jgi:hypothetical protein
LMHLSREEQINALISSQTYTLDLWCISTETRSVARNTSPWTIILWKQ